MADKFDIIMAETSVRHKKVSGHQTTTRPRRLQDLAVTQSRIPQESEGSSALKYWIDYEASSYLSSLFCHASTGFVEDAKSDLKRRLESICKRLPRPLLAVSKHVSPE